MKYTGILLVAILLHSCCKKQLSMQSMVDVTFINFSLSEVDTFYAFPSLVKPPYTDSILSMQRETPDALSYRLKSTSLSPSSAITLLLKDTSIRYEIQVTHSHQESIGKGRCAGSNRIIDSISVNGVIYDGSMIRIVK